MVGGWPRQPPAATKAAGWLLLGWAAGLLLGCWAAGSIAPPMGKTAEEKAAKAAKKAKKEVKRQKEEKQASPEQTEAERKAERKAARKAKRLGEKLEAVVAKKVRKLEVDPDPAPARRVSTGEPGDTPKVVHEVEDLNTTPLGVREARAEEGAAAKLRAEKAALEALVKHTTAVAEQAEKRGGFVATKGGLALVGLVARSMSENPGVGVKNLYKQVCATLGCEPGRGPAPAAREVRKIMAALRDLKSLEAVMSSTKSFSAVGRRADLVKQKQESGPKSEEGSCKLFMGNLSWAIKEEDGEDILRDFFAKVLKKDDKIVDIVRLNDEEGTFQGTGFLEFSSPEAALKALTLHGTECVERPINLHFAKARKEKVHQQPAKELSEKPEGCTTVFVANLPFLIDEKKVNDWANECGEVTSIRWLNDKATGRFKGCGYVEFGAASAAVAVDKMVERNNSELMGRRVRVDYADAKPSRPDDIIGVEPDDEEPATDDS